jgi:hypothetical protein
MLRPFVFLGDYPRDRNNGWHVEAQGVAHDERHWFVTQKDRLWKFPVQHDLNDDVRAGDPGILSVRLADLPLRGYDHFGDLDHHDGRLYVPLEGDGIEPSVAFFDAFDLRFAGYARLSSQREASWCAISPSDGLLYSSDFTIGGDHRPIRKYSRGPSNNRMELVGQFPLRDRRGAPLRIDRVQGGTFSRNGHLYLVSDTREGGILGFDGETGRLILHTLIRYTPSNWATELVEKRKEELEGITIWDLDSSSVSGIKGQVHVLMIDNYPDSDDDLYFKHFRVDAADRSKL